MKFGRNVDINYRMSSCVGDAKSMFSSLTLSELKKNIQSGKEIHWNEIDESISDYLEELIKLGAEQNNTQAIEAILNRFQNEISQERKIDLISTAVVTNHVLVAWAEKYTDDSMLNSLYLESFRKGFDPFRMRKIYLEPHTCNCGDSLEDEPLKLYQSKMNKMNKMNKIDDSKLNCKVKNLVDNAVNRYVAKHPSCVKVQFSCIKNIIYESFIDKGIKMGNEKYERSQDMDWYPSKLVKKKTLKEIEDKPSFKLSPNDIEYLGYKVLMKNGYSTENGIDWNYHLYTFTVYIF